MPFFNTKPSELAYFQETTQGTPPADATAWESEQRIRHIAESLDTSGFQQAVVEDVRSQVRRHAKNVKVKGLRNGEFPFHLYATGSGAATNDASQISQIDLGAVLDHCLGGESLNNTTDAATSGAHTSTAIELTSNTNFAAGQLTAWEHPTTGENYVRRITDLTGDVITLDEALPQSAADDDVVNAMATYYIDPDVLEDSDGSGGPYTFSWFIRKGGVSSGIEYVAKGCKSALQTINLTRGELPILEFVTMFASFDGPDDAPNPTWSSTVDGFAPTAIGPTTNIFLQDYGTTTSVNIHAHEVTVEVGVPVSRIETLTEAQDNMEGTAGYSNPDADTLITIVLGPHAEDLIADFDADTFKVFRWTKRDSAGNLFCFMAPRCEVVEYPVPAEAPGQVWGQRIVLRAHEDLDSVGTTNLIKSKLLIGIG